jgi:hypothetical protein
MNILKKQRLFLGITFLLTIHNVFADLPSDYHDQEPLPASPIDDFIVPMLFIAILFASSFFRLQNKELKKIK